MIFRYVLEWLGIIWHYAKRIVGKTKKGIYMIVRYNICFLGNSE